MAVIIAAMSLSCKAWEAEEHIPFPMNESPTWSPDGSKIAFVSNAMDGQQIWVINLDGTGLRRISSGMEGGLRPTWDRDGGHIHFDHYDDAGNSRIWRMETDGSNAYLVSSAKYDEVSCCISPDGTKMLVDNERGIQVYSIGGVPESYFATPGEDPDYAPDGTKAVFIRNGNVWKRNIDKTGLAQLTTGDYFETTPRWSPDGTKIIFASNRPDKGNRRIWVMAANCTNLHRLLSDDNEPSTVSDSDLAWSPDGSKIAFSRDDGTFCEIWIVNSTGVGLIQLTHTVATPTFSPDAGSCGSGQSVTISCSTEGKTIRYTTDGTDPTESSTVYTSPIQIDHDMTIKAEGRKTDYFASDVKIGLYTLKVAKPEFDPDGGTYTGTQYVWINCGTKGATIRYTTDGSDPTESSPLYDHDLEISSNTTVKAKAFKSGCPTSDVKSAEYVIQ